MARRSTPRQRVRALVDAWEPQLQMAFLASTNDIRNKATIGAIAAALERGDVSRATDLVGIDVAAFRDFDRAIAAAYEAGGVASVNSFPVIRDAEGAKLIIRFDARNPRVEQYLAEHSSTLITRIIDDQRIGIRSALSVAMEAGRNPRSVALEIIGRINRATGRREGGIVGLTAAQSKAVSNARIALSSGDSVQMQSYLNLARRDKRFDNTVLKAIREETAIPSSKIESILGRYSDRLLQLRGETIARTETIGALNRSQIDAYRQAVDAGAIRRQDVRCVWTATKDARTRDTHAALDGETVGLEEPFSNGLQYPGDPAGDPSEVVNCRCTMLTRVDFLSNIE